MTHQPQDNPFIRFVQEYHDKPVEFCINVLNIYPEDYQARLLEDIAAGERLLSVRSGHGTGKSTALAMAAAWYSCTRIRFKIVMTAPTAPQLYDALWSETRTIFRNLPAALRDLFEIKAERINLITAPEEGFISVRTSSKERPEALAGVHADHVLLIGDEASGIPEEVFESAQGSMSGHNATTILTGNPTRLSGLFYRTHHDLADDWKLHHWNSVESPRVDNRFVEQIRRTYGEDSNQFRVRVLGEFPLVEDETLISRASVQAAMGREALPEIGVKRYWALDVARYGGDRSVLVERMGSGINWIEQKSNMDLMNLVGWVRHMYQECKTDKRPDLILVDSIGVGAGVVDRLLGLKLPVRGVNVSESALVFSDGFRLRDQLWLDMKKWLETGEARLPSSRQLEEELCTVSYEFGSNGKIKIEAKSSIKRSGRPSPDIADAVALTFAEEPAVIVGGRIRDSGRALKRGIRAYG